MLNRRMSLRYEKFSRSLILDVKANSLRRLQLCRALGRSESLEGPLLIDLQNIGGAGPCQGGPVLNF